MIDLTVHTKLTCKKQKELICWLAKQNNELKLKVFKEKRNQFFKYKKSHSFLNDEEVDYIAFILSINAIYEKLNYLKKKNKSKSLEELVNISDLELIAIKKTKSCEKKEAIINKYSVLEKLHLEGISWRQISNILKTKYRLSASHTYLKKIYEELNNG